MAELFDIVVRRQIYIEGLKAKKGAEFSAVLSKLRVELAQRLAGFEWDDLGNATRTSLKRLIVDLRKIAKSVFDPYLAALIEWLQRFVKIDLGLLAGLYRDNAEGATFTTPDDERMWALAIGFPMAATGTLALAFINSLVPSTYMKLERLTLQHYANNSTKAELIAAIAGPANAKEPQGLMRQLNAQANAATNTVIQHLSSQVNETLAAKVLGFYEWVSILDDRTTKICRERDGNRYAFGRGPVPPAHVGCRSTIVPVSLSGPKTPSNFDAWLREQPGEFINDALAGQRSKRYERSTPISLSEYGGKSPLIGA